MLMFDRVLNTLLRKSLRPLTRKFQKETHCVKIHFVKIVRIGSFPDPYFPAFRLNTEIYKLNLYIQSECRKIDWNQKNSECGQFSQKDNICYVPFQQTRTSQFSPVVELITSHIGGGWVSAFFVTLLDENKDVNGT